MRRTVRLCLAATMALLTLAVGPRPPIRQALARQAQAVPADALALRVLAGGDDGVAATAQALSLAGIGSIAQDGSAVPAVEPSLPMTMPFFEVSSLAADAAARSQGATRLTLADLGAVLAADDWALPPNTDPGATLARVLRAAIDDARQHPDSPQSITPLFLQAL